MNPTRDPAESLTDMELEAGTGFMMDLAETLHRLAEYGGYTENLTAKGDHFECCSGAHKLYAQDITVDQVIRFENASDPADSSILYAISCPRENIKGVYVEGYGIYQELESEEILEKLKHHTH